MSTNTNHASTETDLITSAIRNLSINISNTDYIDGISYSYGGASEVKTIPFNMDSYEEAQRVFANL